MVVGYITKINFLYNVCESPDFGHADETPFCKNT